MSCYNNWNKVNNCGCGRGHWCNDWCNFRNFTVSGMVMGVNGMPAANVMIEYTIDCNTYTTTTDALGHYAITVPEGANVLIIVTPTVGVTVTPTHHFICKVCANLTGYDFTLNAITPEMFTVSGSVTGLPAGESVMIVYMVNGQLAGTVTDASGNFSFTAPANASISIIPSPQSGFTVTPSSHIIANLTGDVAGQNFNYTAV